MEALSPNTVVVFFCLFLQKNHSACGISLIRTRNISFNSPELLGSTALRGKKKSEFKTNKFILDLVCLQGHLAVSYSDKTCHISAPRCINTNGGLCRLRGKHYRKQCLPDEKFFYSVKKQVNAEDWGMPSWKHRPDEQQRYHEPWSHRKPLQFIFKFPTTSQVFSFCAWQTTLTAETVTLYAPSLVSSLVLSGFAE